jgi:hypothetical protein
MKKKGEPTPEELELKAKREFKTMVDSSLSVSIAKNITDHIVE